MGEVHKITPPLKESDIIKFKSGDIIEITGTIYTARDAAHKLIVSLKEKGEPLPVDLTGAIIYYVGPTPSPPGKPIGSAGPTTSYRMDPYTPVMLELGAKMFIGKGARGKNVREELAKHKAVYCAAVGGAAALISKRIVSSTVIAFEELGPEAMRELQVKDFPCIVVNDIYGHDLYDQGIKIYRRIHD